MFFAANTNTPETNIIAALFLCTTEYNEMLSAIAPELEASAPLPTDEKIALLQQRALIPAGDPYELIFPWKSFLSEGIAFRHFAFAPWRPRLRTWRLNFYNAFRLPIDNNFFSLV